MALTPKRTLILSALIHLRDNGPFEDHTNMGICYNGATFLKLESFEDANVFYDFIDEESQDWPKYSGRPSYPIKSVEPGEYPYLKWEGEQGALRYELIDFLIAKLLEEEKQS